MWTEPDSKDVERNVRSFTALLRDDPIGGVRHLAWSMAAMSASLRELQTLIGEIGLEQRRAQRKASP